MRIIVLDGPDAVGKTTLAKAIIEKYPKTKYFHLGYRYKDRMFDYHTAAIRVAGKAAVTHNVILDRWWPSEGCYASIYRGGSAWPLQGRFLERAGLKYGAVYVMCLPDENTAKRFKKMKEERTEMYEDIKEVSELYTKFYNGDKDHKDKGNYIDQIILNGGAKEIPYFLPYTIEKWGAHKDMFIDMIMHAAKKMRMTQWLTALNPNEHNILGHKQFAKYLFVGDKVHPKYKRLFWPFFEYGNCSLSFTTILNKLWIKERNCAWTNIHHPITGQLDLRFPKAANGHIKIIALGKEAKEALDKNEIKTHAVLKHPQYYRRFLGSLKTGDPLYNDLKEVII